MSTLPADYTESERSSDGDVEADIEMDGGKSASTFFWGGVVLTLFMSLFSLLFLCLHPELRASRRRVGRYLAGVAVACFVHGTIAGVICIVFFWRQIRFAG